MTATWLARIEAAWLFFLWRMYVALTEKPYEPGPLDPWTTGEQKTKAQLRPWSANEMYARDVIWRYSQIYGWDHGQVRLNQLSTHRRRLALLPFRINNQEAE